MSGNSGPFTLGVVVVAVVVKVAVVVAVGDSVVRQTVLNGWIWRREWIVWITHSWQRLMTLRRCRCRSFGRRLPETLLQLLVKLLLLLLMLLLLLHHQLLLRGMSLELHERVVLEFCV